MTAYKNRRPLISFFRQSVAIALSQDESEHEQGQIRGFYSKHRQERPSRQELVWISILISPPNSLCYCEANYDDVASSVVCHIY